MDNLTDIVSAHSEAEIAQAKERVLCGAPTTNGGTCKIPTFGGVCPTHSLSEKELRNRNRKCARNFAENNPQAFHAQRHNAAVRGFVATLNSKGRSVAHEKARAWRLKNPSLPEQFVIDLLDNAGITYEREFVLNGEQRAYVDFQIGNGSLEINHEKQEKRAWLESFGYTVLVVNLTERDVLEQTETAQAARETILQFAHANYHPTQELAYDELPF